MLPNLERESNLLTSNISENDFDTGSNAYAPESGQIKILEKDNRARQTFSSEGVTAGPNSNRNFKRSLAADFHNTASLLSNTRKTIHDKYNLPFPQGHTRYSSMYFAATGHREDSTEPPDEVEPFGWKIGIRNSRKSS